MGDLVWGLRPRPMGTHRTKTWFTPGEVVRRFDEDTYRVKVDPGHFGERHGSQPRAPEPDIRGTHVSLDMPPMKLVQTTTMPSRTTTQSRRSRCSVQMPHWPEVCSSECHGEATVRPTTLGIRSHPSRRGSTLPSWSFSASTRSSSKSVTSKLSPRGLKRHGTYPCPELSPGKEF